MRILTTLQNGTHISTDDRGSFFAEHGPFRSIAYNDAAGAEQAAACFDQRGITRNEAIAIMNRTIEALAAPGPYGVFFERGARAVLRSLIQAGAFMDGTNWADRLPLQPGEGQYPGLERR